MIQRKSLALAVLGSMAVAVAAFYYGRELSANEPVSAEPVVPQQPPAVTPIPAPPGPAVTPDPQATPDLKSPWWHIPYLNREAQLPKFNGIVNGFQVGDPVPRPAVEKIPECSSGYAREFGADVAARYATSPVRIPSQRDLPAGMEIVDGPIYSVCPGGGAHASEATVQVVVPTPGGGSPGTGGITISRRVGKVLSAGVHGSEERWSARTVAGHPAAVLRPVIAWVGDAAIIVYDEASNVTTLLYGGGVYLTSVEQLIEVVLK